MAFFESISNLWIEGRLPETLSRGKNEDESEFHRRLLLESIMENSQTIEDAFLPVINQTFSIGDCLIHVTRELKRLNYSIDTTSIIDISDCYIDKWDLEYIQF